MKSKFLARAVAFAVVALIWPLCGASSPVMAQEESLPTVVDEVIAQVNNDVITLSMLKRDAKEFAETLKQQRKMTEEQAAEEIARRQPEIIASMVDEQLLMQRGKEIPGLTEDVEAEVNREMLRVAKSQGIKTIEELDAALRASGLEPAGIRQTLRAQFMRTAVLQREVDAKVYFGITNEEARKYYEAHRDKFRKQESVELSEIYLSMAGKPEAEVRAKAEELVAQARAGTTDFATLAATNSEREQDGVRVAPQNKGKVGRFQITDLRADIAALIKNLKVGGVSDPIRLDEGFQILRLDERAPGGEPTFVEEQVRGAITAERADKERNAFIQKLRREAYFKIAPSYEATVLPLLKTGAETTNPTAAPAAKDSKEKKPKDKKSN